MTAMKGEKQGIHDCDIARGPGDDLDDLGEGSREEKEKGYEGCDIRGELGGRAIRFIVVRCGVDYALGWPW